jgi:CDGSH-type Zn-finger protein
MTPRFDRKPKPKPDVTVITPYRDGPLLVRGPVKFVDQEGKEILVERETVALCRCGKSRIRPLCDGTHKLLGFKAPSGLEGRGRKELSPAAQASST